VRRREVVAAAAGAALLARPAAARAQDRREAGVLSLALRVENTSVFACDAVAEAGVLHGAAARRLDRVRDHEAAHAEAIAAALRAIQAPLPAPPRALGEVEIPQVRAGLDALDGPDDAIALLIEVERLSLEAHRAGIARLREVRHVHLLATILAAEATHLVAWGAVG